MGSLGVNGSLLLLISFTVLCFGDSLYDASDPILELNIDTFDKSVYGEKKAFFVEFYSSWCGACIAYAPTFKKFARLVQSWKPVVQVTVVNCAEDKNMPLCREHEIHAFPTIKYFKYNSKGKEDMQLYQGDKYNIGQLSLDLAQLVKGDAEAQKPSEWPLLDPVPDTTSLDEIWQSTTTKFVLLVSENEPKMGTAEAINFHGDRHVKVVIVRPSNPVASSISLFAGKAALLQRGTPNPVWISGDTVTWEQIQEKVNELVSAEPAGQVVEPVLNQPREIISSVDLSQYQVQAVDLQSALGYMLLKEIVRREKISGPDFEALKQWIHVLKKYSPGTAPIRRLLHRLDEWIQLKQFQVTADEWTQKVNELQLDLGNPLPSTPTWLSCQGSKSNLRGYTCGLWTLGHAIAAQAYNQEKDNSLFSPVREVLDPWKQFITRFLSCQECAENFEKESTQHGLSYVTRKEDMVMWLVKVHNSVNKRLSGAAAEDPKFPKRQFPPKELCAHCYNAAGDLDETETFKFVLAYYTDIRTDPVEPAPAYQMSEFKGGKLEKVANRQLNPKFAVNANPVDDLEAEEERMKKLDRNPQREWRSLDGSNSGFTPEQSERTHFYFFLLSFVALAVFIAYYKYRQNKSRFWKQFYYSSDFKLKQNIA
ncbi:unnamed protein product, partial [Mesorhabditis belari]|uniref:Sulfhydryl oxidase n=1 Tax=Mesorhabditis belari TaxID=2138241 RepID=A0AAF3EYX0_9BILA